MISQFSSRKYRITSRGKIALERKEEMKKRGLQSPIEQTLVARSKLIYEGLKMFLFLFSFGIRYF